LHYHTNSHECINRAVHIADAEDLFRQALSIREAAVAPTDRHVVATLTELADLCDQIGKPAEANQLREHIPLVALKNAVRQIG
jgi:hypothetical protein